MRKSALIPRRVLFFVTKTVFWVVVWIACSFLTVLGISMFHAGEDSIILNGCETLIMIIVPILLCVILGWIIRKDKMRNGKIGNDLAQNNVSCSDIQDGNRKTLVQSRYSSYPRFYIIDGVSYDLDNPASIKKMPVFSTTFVIEGKSYQMESLLHEHARQCVDEDIRNAAYEKAEEFAYARVSNVCSAATKRENKDNSSRYSTMNQNTNELRESEYSLESVDSMSGYEFERWCAALLSKHGYTKVSLTKESGDQGVDILAERDGIRYAIQCKCYAKDVGNSSVQEVNAGKMFYNCQIGVVMTNRYFTKGAKEIAKSTGTLLWDRDWLSAHNLPIKDNSGLDVPKLAYDGMSHDELLWDAWNVISVTRLASVTVLERHLRIGYARAARIIDELEEMGYIGPFRGSKPREILK